MANYIISWVCVLFVCYHNSYGTNPVQEPATTQLKSIIAPFVNCRILINEIDFSAIDSSTHFIELSKFCSVKSKRERNVNLKPFKLLFISDESEILMSCSLDGQMTDKLTTESENSRRFFYVVGGSGLRNNNYKLSECQSDKSLNGMLPTGKEKPFGVVLLYGDRSEGFNGLELTPDPRSTTGFSKKKMLGIHVEKIRRHIQDFQIYGSTTKYYDCDIFQKIYSGFTDKPITILRDWISLEEDEKSINRCGASSEPFAPESMKYAIPTPGSDNLCTNGVEFCLENALEKLPRPIGELVAQGERCYIGNKNNEDGSLQITEDLIDEHYDNTVIDDKFIACDEDDVDIIIDLNDKEDAQIVNEFENINKYLNFYDPLLKAENKHIWEDCSGFDSSITSAIAEDISPEHILRQDVCSWFGLDQTDRNNKKGYCKFCQPLYSRGVLLDKDSSPLLSEFLKNGFWHKGEKKPMRENNRKMILKHVDSELHKISVQYFTNLDNGLISADFNKAMMDSQGEYYKFFEQTEKFIIAVYQSIKMGLPFFKFELLADTLSFAGFNTGRLHQNAVGAKRALMVISDSMHKELVFHLTSKSPLLNIILDDSTDVSGFANSEILFQTFDANNRVKTYHYKLLNLKYGGKGKAIFRVFYEQIKRDKLEKLIVENAIGMTSDGASTLQSVFYKRLQQKCKRPLLHVHCHGHKLELVIKNSIKEHAYLSTIDKKINRIHAFFNSQATKRKSVLRRKAVEKTATHENSTVPGKTFELKRVHPIRWITHSLSAYQCILKNWKVIVESVEEIYSRVDFTKKQKDTAGKLLLFIKDATFLTHVAFLADIAEKLSTISKNLQKKSDNLIGKTKLRDEVILGLGNYATDSGSQLQKLVLTAEIAVTNEDAGDDNPNWKKVADFENSYVVLNDTVLSLPNNLNANNTFYTNVDAYMASIFQNYDKYFPRDLATNSFDIFDPLGMQIIGETDIINKHQICSINAELKLGFDNNTLFESWKSCANSIIRNNGFMVKKVLSAKEFWYYYLHEPSIKCTEELKYIIKVILLTPGTSSSAEQSFSLVSALKTGKRYSLATSTVDAELRIKLNGEKKIEHVNTFAYAREFTKQHRRVDDKHRALPAVKDDAEYDNNGERFKSIFDKP